jgi:hypothetical protein
MYQAVAPIGEPADPDAITPTKLRSPFATRKPANGRINSEGIAGITFSRIISTAIPKYPAFLMTSSSHSSTRALPMAWASGEFSARQTSQAF